MNIYSDIIEQSQISINDVDLLFEWACNNSQIELAKWLVIEYNIDVHANNHLIFINSCADGRFEIIKWLATEHNVDVHINNEEAFRYSCRNGFIEIAKWLVTEYNVDIHANNEYAFAYSCVNNHLGIVKLFTEEYNFNNFKYAYHNGAGYIINHPKLKGWKSCIIMDCPIIYVGVLNKQAIIQIMNGYKIYKSARS